MEYKGYAGSVEFDPDAEILHGEVLGIRDVVTFEGNSVREVLEAFKDSVDDYLEFCAERGEKPDKPRSGKFVLRLGPDLHRRIAMVARTSRTSMNELVVNCLWAAFPPGEPTAADGGSLGSKPRKRRARRQGAAR